MPYLVRFGVSIEKDLIDKFDRFIAEKNYTNRSEAIRDLIRENLVKKEWLAGSLVAGAVTIVYDHHRRELVNKIMDLQHDFNDLIISSQHVHLDHHNCLEIIAVKGDPRKIEKLASNLKAVRGVKHSQLTMTTTGENLE